MIRQAAPSIVGRPGNAPVATFSLQPPDVYQPLAQGLQGFGSGLEKLSNTLIGIQGEEENLKYKTLYNNAVLETGKKLQDEVFSTSGEGAEGSVLKAHQIFSDVSSKYKEGLTDYGRLAFDSSYTANMESWTNQALTHERTQINKAQNDADKLAMSSAMASYVADPNNSAHLDSAIGRYTDMFTRANGKRIDMASFDKDAADGVLNTGSGAPLRIVDKTSGAPDEITKEAVASLRERLAKSDTAYNDGKQQIIDDAHIQTVENYLKYEKLSDAEKYLSGVSDGPYKASDAARKLLADRVAKSRESADISSSAVKAVSELAVIGGKYGNEEQDKAYTDKLAFIADTYSGEKAQLGQRLLGSFEQNYRILQQRQKAAAASDVIINMKDMQTKGLNVPQMGAHINAMPDSPVKTAMIKYYDRLSDTFNKQDDPAFAAMQEKKLNEYKLSLEKGKAVVDNIEYDLGNPQQLKAYTLAQGFTDKNAKRAIEYAIDKDSRIDALDAGTILAQLSGGKDAYEALARYPTMLQELEYRKGSEVIPKKDTQQWLKANIADLIMNNVEKDISFFPDMQYQLKYAVKDGSVPVDSMYRTQNQMDDAYRRELSYRAMRDGNMDALRKAQDKKNTMSQNAINDYARATGWELKGGYYRLKGNK